MAESILLEFPTRDPRAELLARLEKAPAEHAEALLSGYEVLQGLHDAGILNVLRGVLGAGNEVLDNVVELTQKPGSIRALRNLIILLKTLESIDPDVLRTVAAAVPEVVESINNAHSSKAPSLLQTVRLVTSENTRRGIAAINGAFQSVRDVCTKDG